MLNGHLSGDYTKGYPMTYRGVIVNVHGDDGQKKLRIFDGSGLQSDYEAARQWMFEHGVGQWFNDQTMLDCLADQQRFLN